MWGLPGPKWGPAQYEPSKASPTWHTTSHSHPVPPSRPHTSSHTTPAVQAPTKRPLPNPQQQPASRLLPPRRSTAHARHAHNKNTPSLVSVSSARRLLCWCWIWRGGPWARGLERGIHAALGSTPPLGEQTTLACLDGNFLSLFFAIILGLGFCSGRCFGCIEQSRPEFRVSPSFVQFRICLLCHGGRIDMVLPLLCLMLVQFE